MIPMRSSMHVSGQDNKRVNLRKVTLKILEKFEREKIEVLE